MSYNKSGTNTITIQVEIFFSAWQIDILGNGDSPAILKESVDRGATFTVLLDQLIDKYPALLGTAIDPESRRVYDHTMIILNGRAIDLVGGTQVQLNEGDNVQFLPLVAGG